MEFERDFLKYLKKRQNELEAKIALHTEELNRLRKMSQQMGKLKHINLDFNSYWTTKKKKPIQKADKTIKEMIREILQKENGITAQEILKKIHKRWLPELMRSSLSPQLSRMKQTGEIEDKKGIWFFIKKT